MKQAIISVLVSSALILSVGLIRHYSQQADILLPLSVDDWPLFVMAFTGCYIGLLVEGKH